MIKYFHLQRIVRSLILAACTCIVVIAISYLAWQPTDEINLSEKGKEWFEQRTLLTDISALFDLGVVDINSDNAFDIFTSNHSDKQFLLLGKGDGRFSNNMISQLKLDQQPEFPGLEPSEKPVIDSPGLYIYWQERNLILQEYDNENRNPIKGTIKVSSPARIKQNHNFSANIQEQKISSGAVISTIEFAAKRNHGKVALSPYNQSLPISFTLDEQLPLDQVYIGNNKINPDSHQFILYLRDRHGMAWADYDNEGAVDVFAVRGGLRGRMDTLPEQYADELLVNQNGLNYADRIEQSGIVKEGCPALQTAWVDYNNDGLLDIYVVCFTPVGSTRSYPNQLYRQNFDGKFTNIAADVNLDILPGGSFVWLDVDQDRDLDLLWVDAQTFWLYLNQAGRFEPQRIGKNPGNVTEQFSDSNKLTIADYDNDGDLDGFFASPGGNALLINTNGTYNIVEPERVGLPVNALTANWVDYDNDGLTDLHASPTGVYRQHQDHTFEATHLLESQSSGSLSTWFDADNNGSRDLLITISYPEPQHKQIFRKIYSKLFQQELKRVGPTLALYSNLGATNHWLQIKLIGRLGNRQAIGTQVEVITSDEAQLQAVGQAEGSHYSQGQYRLYFGLGQHQTVRAVKVYWNDGKVQEIKNPAIDQLLVINQEET